MVIRKDRHAEISFAAYCVADGAVCNEPRDDQNGWDHIVEIQPAKNAMVPPDRQPKLLTSLVQVKTTSGSSPVTRIKLSNAMKAVQSDLPCFVVLFWHHDGKIRIYGKHIRKNLIEATLLRARESEKVKRAALHKSTLSIAFNPEDEIGSGIVPWMISQISLFGDDYATSKEVIRKTAGYEEVYSVGTFTIGPIENLEQISDHELGLLEDLPVENFTIYDQRFGIQAASPIISAKSGRVSIGQREPKNAVFRLIRSDGERLDIPAQVTAPTLISAKSEAFKVRIRAGFLDCVVALNRTVRNWNINYDYDKPLPLKDHERFATFISWITGGWSRFELWSDIGKLFSGSIDIDLGQAAHFLSISKFLSAIAGEVQSQFIIVKGSELALVWKEIYPAQFFVGPEAFRITAQVDSAVSDAQRILAYSLTGVGEWAFAAILSFNVDRVQHQDKNYEWYFHFERLVDVYVAKVPIEKARSEIELKFQELLATSERATLHFDDGDFATAFKKLSGGMPVAFRTSD